MSKVKARTEASSAFDLRDEINRKLRQAKGICIVICDTRDMDNTPVSASLWAASELIEEAEKAVDALYEQASRSVEEEVQS